MPQPDQPQHALEGGQLDLASLVAHEFRGPVHALQAYLSVLLREQAGPITELQREFLSSMYSVARRLERLTNDIHVLHSSHAEFQIVPEPVDLFSLVQACAWELQPVAEGFAVALDVTSATSGACVIHADPVRIEQIVLNLLENAIRYSVANTTVRVRVRCTQTRSLLVIENTVEHEPKTAPEEWFSPFVRGLSSNKSHPDGLGLGLAVVAQLVQAHHGRILTRVRNHHVAITVALLRDPFADR